MNQNLNNKAFIKPLCTVLGALTGAVIALAFAKSGNSGLIGVGAVLGVSIGNAFYRRFKEHN
jgi:hypothetical protein